MRETHELEEALHHHFKNPALLVTALTHTSYANEAKHGVRHNERLEFLGDSVLSIVVAEYLFTHKNMPEGELTRMRASLVCEAALFEFAKQISLGDYLRLGRGEERGGGRCRPSILSDAFEAVIAALYLDGGMETARAFIRPGPQQAFRGGGAPQFQLHRQGRGAQQKAGRAAGGEGSPGPDGVLTRGLPRRAKCPYTRK